MIDRRRLESAATEYHHLRGLFGIPLGLAFVLSALGNESWGPLRHAWVFLIGLGIIGLMCLAVHRFYEDHYGRVRLTSAQQTRAAVAALVVAPVMFLVATLLRSQASWSLDLPVNAIPASFALVMLAFYGATVGVRVHHVAVLGALLAAGLLPVWDGDDPSNIGLVMCGAAVMVSGAFDHRLLMRSMGGSHALRAGESDAGA